MSSWTIISRASLAAALLSGAALAQNPIEVERLDALDPLEVGLPGAALSNRLWDGTGAAMAQAVLTRLPGTDGDGYASEALAETARSVLVSGGRPPAGGERSGWTGKMWLTAVTEYHVQSANTKHQLHVKVTLHNQQE